MGLEIERKFLLLNDLWRDQIDRSLPMAQAYLGGENCSVRVRISGMHAWLNIKSAVAGPSRQEFEYAIPIDDAQALMALAGGPSIDKVRHLVSYQGWTWEIDEFKGANHGLIVAEIELPRVDAPFPSPDWLGAEVTEDRRYYNAALATRPYSNWDQR